MDKRKRSEKKKEEEVYDKRRVIRKGNDITDALVLYPFSLPLPLLLLKEERHSHYRQLSNSLMRGTAKQA